MCQFGLALDGDVATEVKLLLQLDTLRFRVHDAVLVFGARLACVQQREQKERKLVMLLGNAACREQEIAFASKRCVLCHFALSPN